MTASEANGYDHQRDASKTATLTAQNPSSNHSDTSEPALPENYQDRKRTLVLCFDGTGDQFDNDNSNIVEFFATLKKDDSDLQMCYYQAGIGTYTSPLLVTPLMSRISKILDEAIAWNLHRHVMDGYEFLMQNYKDEDRISIFGFSRGAYTARALAGMIHKVGILPACNHQQVPFAYKMFIDETDDGWKQSDAFKNTFSVKAKINFVGVWDTVNSVGLIPRRLPFTKRNPIIGTFRHAVALDERRAMFKAKLNRDRQKEMTMDPVEPEHEEKHSEEKHSEEKHRKSWFEKKLEKKPKRGVNERKYSEKSDTDTNVKEVWFAGCHCDVGGGSVKDKIPHSLARISLRWMIRECFETETGIMFRVGRLRKLGINLDTLHPPLHPTLQSRPARLSGEGFRLKRIPKTEPSEDALSKYAEAEPPMSEEERERRDALSPIYDQLELAWPWWILEYLPMKQKHYNKGSDEWEKKRCLNRGQGRHIPKQNSDSMVYIHRSVLTRGEALPYKGGKRYKSKASYKTASKRGKIVWVD